MARVAMALLGMLGGAAGTKMTKWLLPEGTKGGLCMDGTPAGVYYAPAPSANSTTWVIYFAGGGACYDKTSCDKRAKTDLGSSKNWPASAEVAEMFLQDDEGENPDFYDSYKVFVKYCTGDGHLGQRSAPDASSWGYYFSGHTSLEHILAMLLNDATTGPKLKAANHVLVTGGSAGGLGAFGNVDYIASQLSWATTKGIPRCGFFFPGHTDDQADPAFPPSDFAHWSNNQSGSMFESNYTSLLYQPYQNADCLKAFPASQSWACGSVANLYPFIQTPIFLLENQYDTNQLQNQLGAPLKNAATDPQVQGFIAYFGRAMRATITKDYLKKGDGAFLPSCLDHGGGLGLAPTDTTIPNAPTQRALVGDWYWGRGQIKEYFVPDTCSRPDGLPCNPTCDGVKPSPGPGPGPSPPGPGPSPPGPSDPCTEEMKSDGCVGLAKKDCTACAQVHEKDLEKAGCTQKEVKQLCGYGL